MLSPSAARFEVRPCAAQFDDPVRTKTHTTITMCRARKIISGRVAVRHAGLIVKIKRASRLPPDCPSLDEALLTYYFLPLVPKSSAPHFFAVASSTSLAGFGHRRKIFDPLVGPGRVDDRPRVEAFLGRMR